MRSRDFLWTFLLLSTSLSSAIAAPLWVEPRAGWALVRPRTLDQAICTYAVTFGGLVSRRASEWARAHYVDSAFLDAGSELNNAIRSRGDAAHKLLASADTSSMAKEIQRRWEQQKAANPVWSNVEFQVLEFRSERVGIGISEPGPSVTALKTAAGFTPRLLQASMFHRAEDYVMRVRLTLEEIANAKRLGEIGVEEANALADIIKCDTSRWRQINYIVRHPGPLNLEWERTAVHLTHYGILTDWPTFR